MIKTPLRIRLAAVVLVCAATSMTFQGQAASAEPDPSRAGTSGLYMKVQLARPEKMSKLKPGNVVEGILARDVYSSDRKLFSAGSAVRLTVDHLEKRRRTPNDHWPGVIRLFTPRHENYPVFKTGTVAQAGRDVSLEVSLISVSRRRDVHAQAKKGKSAQPSEGHGGVRVVQTDHSKTATPVMILEASSVDNLPSAMQQSAAQEEDASRRNAASPDSINPEELPTGTRCKILLLGDVSASKSKPGDAVHARLLEPVMLNSKVVLPAGSSVEGKVVKKTVPKWLSRAGSLYLSFTELTLPGGNRIPVTASLAGAELDRRSHTRIDPEGGLHGERPGKAWMAINLGVTAGLAKEADDTFQLIFEAIVSTATDASTAGTARIIATCVSGVYMATRKGRDVMLPRFTEMELSLDRPLTVKIASVPNMGVAATSGK